MWALGDIDLEWALGKLITMCNEDADHNNGH